VNGSDPSGHTAIGWAWALILTEKNVLQMSSGIRFTEDYGDLKSDIVRLVVSFTTGSLNEFVAGLHNERKPGTFNQYISADTQVLSMVLKGATKKSLTEYMQEKLWSHLGAEYNAEWLTDPTGTEMAFGGLNATLRDYARLRKGVSLSL